MRGLYRKTKSKPIIVAIFVGLLVGYLGVFLSGLLGQVEPWLTHHVSLTDVSQSSMTYIEYEYVDPGFSERLKADSRVSRVWVSGDSYLNMLEAPDALNGIQPQFILNLPKGWTINQFTKFGREGAFNEEVFRLSRRVFPRLKEPFLNELFFGRELSFFKNNRATESDINDEKQYLLQTEPLVLKLNTRLNHNSIHTSEEIPVSLEVSWNQRRLRVNYLKYSSELEFDPKKFIPEEGLRIANNERLLLSTDPGDQDKRKQMEEMISARREFFTHFYEHPTIHRLNELLETYEISGIRSGIPNLGAFLGAVFQRYPEAVETILNNGKQRQPDIQLEIYRGLQRCPSSLCKIVLEQNPYSFRHELNQRFAQVAWPPLEKLDAPTYQGLGEYWSHFYVTGEEPILTRILQISTGELRHNGSLIKLELDPNLRQAFKQSLIENAKEHKRVDRFLGKALNGK